MSDWRPQDYLAFADERTRPARDLLAKVPMRKPRRVYDLGCGPGNSTGLLVRAFPSAEVIGIDNSPAMIAAAEKAVPGASFQLADLSTWRPGLPADLLFSNATFQWVTNHLEVIAALADSLSAEGVLAVQMPDNLNEPSHRLMAETAVEGSWASRLAEAASARDSILTPSAYYNRLKPLFASFDVWHSIYNHPVQGVGGIVQWLMSTGLRPYLNGLDPAEQPTFLTQYQQKLSRAYATNTDGTVLLRFPRLFMVGVR